MKKLILFPLLFLLSCSPSNQLNKATIDTWKSQAITYYNSRVHGQPFSSQFYNVNDSTYAALSANQKSLNVYKTISAIRPGDSLNKWNRSEFATFKNIIVDDFNVINPAAK